uniref:Transmembrane protein n=1 Tax=Steinernema glaseri TaxID=37863 RepID=A0A1I7ZT21_9BILA
MVGNALGADRTDHPQCGDRAHWHWTAAPYTVRFVSFTEYVVVFGLTANLVIFYLDQSVHCMVSLEKLDLHNGPRIRLSSVETDRTDPTDWQQQ